MTTTSDARTYGAFLGALGTMTVRTSNDFLYMDGLHGTWATLVPATSPNPPDGGRLRLALRDIVDGSPQANTKGFLSSLVIKHAFIFDINPALDKVKSSDDILRGLGLHASQAAGKTPPVADPKVPAPPPPDANVDMTDDGKKNDAVVESMSANSKVTAIELYVRDQPTIKGKNHVATLKKGDVVYIMGQAGDWYLLDHNGVRGYSNKSFIEVV